MATLTDRAIESAIQQAARSGRGKWLNESRGRGLGTLAIKVGTGGSASVYYRYWQVDQNRFLLLGAYGRGPDELTLAAARLRCGESAAKRQQLDDGDLHAEARARKARAIEDRARLEVEAERRGKLTLSALFAAYLRMLDAQGKQRSAADARRLFRLHVEGAFPLYARAPAAELTTRQAAEIFRRLVDAGKGRTAAKVRSYLRAAYAVARGAEGNAAAPADLIPFAIEHNPIADTASLAAHSKAGNRHLSESELRGLWARLGKTEGMAAEAVRVALLAGGQRMAQLLRATATDFDPDAKRLVLLDGKGRRQQPRRHEIALGPRAAGILERLAKQAATRLDSRLFGRTVPDSAGDVVGAISSAMVEAGDARGPFAFRDMRRTTETLMAEQLRISKDIRARIQSHGLGGVQERHYDRADYGEQVRAALVAWESWLVEGPRRGNVRPLSGAA